MADDLQIHYFEFICNITSNFFATFFLETNLFGFLGGFGFLKCYVSVSMSQNNLHKNLFTIPNYKLHSTDFLAIYIKYSLKILQNSYYNFYFCLKQTFFHTGLKNAELSPKENKILFVSSKVLCQIRIPSL